MNSDQNTTMKLRALALLLTIPFALVGLTSCTTAEMTPAEKEEAADRRVKHATEHIRKVQRGRPRGH